MSDAGRPCNPSAARASCDVQLLGVNLSTRWTTVTDELRTLAHGLHTELGPLRFGKPLPLPVRKARLTRRGGRCEMDGTPLTFEPWQPDVHTCPTCHAVYRGAEHDDWWAMGAQLWCAERTLHSAILGCMWNDHALLSMAQQALDTLSARWDTYPNRDNVLGPSRLFFSTYLESVWLLNTTLAAQVLRSYGESTNACERPEQHDAPYVSRASVLSSVNRFISRVVEPCRALIGSYPEGMSNRQTWHTAALLSAASLLRDDSPVESLIDGAQGVSTLINRGLLTDGTWYEGENYHLFAHRGLWYGVTLLESLGVSIPNATNARFVAGFRTPFLGVLPDGTFPSRRDSRYAVSVHQWRFAEWCELGLQRADDELLRIWLHRLYSAPLPKGDTGRSRSTADIERDEPAQRLARSELGWRTLLFARRESFREQLSAGEGSIMLPAQGLHVLRRDADRIYVAVEGGHTGGGHGHPDRLALTIQDGNARVLEDPGTGSYVERTLHWYRSTLSHNAPLINGRSQPPVAAELLAFEARSGVAWTRVRASELSPGVTVQRTAVLLDEHVVDHLEWSSADSIMIDLPIHMDGETADKRVWTSGQPFDAGGLEDGVNFLRDAERTPLVAGELVAIVRPEGVAETDVQNGAGDQVVVGKVNNAAINQGRTNFTSVRCWYALSDIGEMWRAIAPGPPGRGEQRMYWLRARGVAGEMVGVWSLRGSVDSVSCADNKGQLLPVQVVMRNGTMAAHAPTPNGWHVDLCAGRARSSLDLQALPEVAGDVSASVPSKTSKEPSVMHAPSEDASADASATPATRSPVRVDCVLHDQSSIHFVLGEQHYRRSEQSWLEAGSPMADVQVRADERTLHIRVAALTGPVVVPEPNAINHLDNERADVNADGLQLYIAPMDASEWTGAWLIVPHPDGARVTTLTAEALNGTADRALKVQSEHTDTGWTMDIELCLDNYGLAPSEPFRFDLVVNERPPDRERRRGQLVLSGSRGEFVYLRGDRHDLLRSWVLHCVPSHASRSLSKPLV